MKNVIAATIIFSIVIVTFLQSCKRDHAKETASDSALEQSTDTLNLKQIDLLASEALSDSLSPQVDTISETKGLFGGKGKLWKVWEKLHKSCQNNAMTQGMTYLGVSNNMNVGSILMYDKTKGTYLASYPMSLDKFTKEEKRDIFAPVTSAKCDNSVKTKLSLDFLIKSKIVESGNVSLSTHLENSRSIESSIESYEQDMLYVDKFSILMNKRKDDYAMEYLQVAKREGRYVIVTAIQVKGFSATITTKNKIDANLRAELQNGISDKIEGTDATIKFTYEGEHTIKATTLGSFVVFGTLYHDL